jgi:hypothetical protein
MKKEYIIIIALFFCLESLFAQKNKQFVQKKKNPFEMVHVGDSIRKKLYGFISNEGQNTENAGMYIYHLLGEDKANNYQFVEGVYSFRLMGPHFPIYYFIYTKKGGIQIIKDYLVENMLTQVIECFKKSEESFDESKKIAYIEAMIHDLNHRNDVYGDSEILKKTKIPN